ncbi:hypothetical protein C0993_007151 [Termitomyces sp. T159_Od127]|nr:hypothetical protein C0993_007151 [Termitomyces sp. T159_Od127]
MFTTKHDDAEADADASIRETDGDAALARLSAVRKGYMEDRFIAHFVPRARTQGARPPLINIGTYVRGRAIDGLVEAWLEGKEGVQVVSMGAGSDTRFWRLATGKYKDVLRVYVEMDFAEVTGRKAMAIRKSRELSGVLGEGVRVENGGTALHGDKYHLLPGDLRLGPETALGVLRGILDAAAPTLLLFECVLVYMEPGESEGLLRWFVEYCTGAVGGVVYEMFGLEDAFGRVMVRNLKVGGALGVRAC